MPGKHPINALMMAMICTWTLAMTLTLTPRVMQADSVTASLTMMLAQMVMQAVMVGPAPDVQPKSPVTQAVRATTIEATRLTMTPRRTVRPRAMLRSTCAETALATTQNDA